eukprot:8691878-Pyramimonas_sp.AAC.1
MISCAIGAGFAQEAQRTVDWAQTGFVKGRQVTDNILEVSSLLTVWVDAEGDRDCGATLADFQTAFPGLANSLLFGTCMRALYKNIHAAV